MVTYDCQSGAWGSSGSGKGGGYMVANSGCGVVNPMTGGYSCPTGFTAYKISIVNANSWCSAIPDQQLTFVCQH
jgi:hypothetical protein